MTIRHTEDPREILGMVLRSLELHRTAKAEDEILERLAERFELPLDERDSWPSLLTARGIPVEQVLDCMLRLLAPFVAMIVDIYDFTNRYVSTTGGRTEHFALNSNALDHPWTFDTSKMPRLLRLIRHFAEIRLEIVEVDWRKIGRLLRVDNGIFYGTVRDQPLIQSLILSRSRGRLDPALRKVGSDLREALQEAVSAWVMGRLETEAESEIVRQIPLFVPQWASMSSADEESIGIAIDRALGPAGYSLSEVFGPLDNSHSRTLEDDNVPGAVEAAVLFCALWGLDDRSFPAAADHLGVEHSSRSMDDELLITDGSSLGRHLVESVRQSVQPTGEQRHRRHLVESMIEILLLPYWKDRWFLYEVWTLLQPLTHFLEAGVRVELVGLSEIHQPDVQGTTWNLPTQKATEPVARLTGTRGSLLVWFQRETKRLDSDRAMEPDVRLTFPWAPYPDLAIIECKDRVDFRSGGRKVLRSYLDGSSAREVWVVNYEPVQGVKRFCEMEWTAERRSCLVEQFRPDNVPQEFVTALQEWGEVFLGVATEEHEDSDTRMKSYNSILIVDTSGSMDGKKLPPLPFLSRFVPHRRNDVKRWADRVSAVDDSLWDVLTGARGQLVGQSFEQAAALASFAAGLAGDARLVLITDHGGRDSLRTVVDRTAPSDRSNSSRSRETYQIAGRPIEIWCIEDSPKEA